MTPVTYIQHIYIYIQRYTRFVIFCQPQPIPNSEMMLMDAEDMISLPTPTRRRRRRRNNESFTTTFSFRSTTTTTEMAMMILLHLSITTTATTNTHDVGTTVWTTTQTTIKPMIRRSSTLTSHWSLILQHQNRSDLHTLPVWYRCPPLSFINTRIHPYTVPRGGGGSESSSSISSNDDDKDTGNDDIDIEPIVTVNSKDHNDENDDLVTDTDDNYCDDSTTVDESNEKPHLIQNSESVLPILLQPPTTPTSTAAATTVLSKESLLLEENTDNFTNVEQKGKDNHPVLEVTSQPRISPPPPLVAVSNRRPNNAMYRFLLRQGEYGAVVVMLAVFVQEWCNMYLPPFMALLSWIIRQIWPSLLEDHDHDDDDIMNRYRRPKRLSRQERQIQTKYEDAVAWQQLQRWDTKQTVIYRYVSSDFLQRHRIGPYSTTKLSSLQDVTKVMRRQSTPNTAGADTTARGSPNEEEEEEDDMDWVVEALTSPKSPIRPIVQPSISIGIGSSNHQPSIEMGLSIDFGTSKMKPIDRRRNVIAKAITAESNLRRNQNSRSRNSNVNHKSNASSGSSSSNGSTDSLLDKFRAVTGTDSTVLSRTLLGAYPGDAVPISEAANPKGVIELALKYGYGDWSEDDEDFNDNDKDDDFNSGGVKVVTPTKKRNAKLAPKKKKKPILARDLKHSADAWKNRNTTTNNSSESKSVSISLSLSSHERKPQQQRHYLKPRTTTRSSSRTTTNANHDDASWNRPTTTVSATSSVLPSSSSIILQRHKHHSFQTKVKSKVRAATELLSEKRRELSSTTRKEE